MHQHCCADSIAPVNPSLAKPSPGHTHTHTHTHTQRERERERERELHTRLQMLFQYKTLEELFSMQLHQAKTATQQKPPTHTWMQNWQYALRTTMITSDIHEFKERRACSGQDTDAQMEPRKMLPAQLLCTSHLLMGNLRSWGQVLPATHDFPTILGALFAHFPSKRGRGGRRKRGKSCVRSCVHSVWY